MAFLAPPGYQPIYNPSIPYIGPVYGGLRPGMSIYIQGKIHHHISRFHVNLKCGEFEGCDIAFHLNPRFDLWDKVIFNTFQNGSWEGEEKVRHMPFHKGQHFELIIVVNSEGYQVNVNGKEFHLFQHRIPVGRVCALEIGGDVVVEAINIIGGMQGGIGGMQGGIGGMQGGIGGMQGGIGGMAGGYSLDITEDIGGDYPAPGYGGMQGGIGGMQGGIGGMQGGIGGMQGGIGGMQGGIGGMQGGIGGMQGGIGGMAGGYPGPGIGGGYPTPGSGGGYPGGVMGGFGGGYPGPGIGGGGPAYPGGNLPVMGLQPIFNPCIPYSDMIPGGMICDRTVIIRGMVPCGANRFCINFVAGGTRDIFFHLHVRVRERLVIRNSQISGYWGEEERDVGFNPFMEGQYFEISIRCGEEKFKVFANGQHLCTFFHRSPYNQISMMEVEGDVQLSYIHY